MQRPAIGLECVMARLHAIPDQRPPAEHTVFIADPANEVLDAVIAHGLARQKGPTSGYVRIL